MKNHQLRYVVRMMMILFAGAVCVSGLQGCASHADPPPPSGDRALEPVANRAARQVDAPYYVDIEFDKGSSRIEEASRAAISALLRRAKAQGALKDVKVLAWGDEEYPTRQQKKLSKTQRKLAAARNTSIQSEVKALEPTLPIELHSMAERPSAVSNFFDTKDARFKRALIAAGLPTTADEDPVAGRASHAVVLVTLK